MINKELNNLLSKLKNRIKLFRLKIVFSAWSIRVFIAAANRNNPLLNYLHTKHADIWLEQATQIKASMGVSREKNDKSDRRCGRFAKNWTLCL